MWWRTPFDNQIQESYMAEATKKAKARQKPRRPRPRLKPRPQLRKFDSPVEKGVTHEQIEQLARQ